MDALLKLSPAQSQLLRTAARRPDGRVIPPDMLRGGARVKVLTALLQRGWIEPADDRHVMTDAGYAAIGQQRPVPQDDVQPMDANDDLQLLEGIPVRSTDRDYLRLLALYKLGVVIEATTDTPPGIIIRLAVEALMESLALVDDEPARVSC